MKNYTKKVSELNRASEPMVASHFHVWLMAGPKPSSRQMVTIPLYLASLGYEKGRDVIDSSVIRILGHIHSHYWYKRMKAHPVSQPVGYYSLIDAGE